MAPKQAKPAPKPAPKQAPPPPPPKEPEPPKSDDPLAAGKTKVAELPVEIRRRVHALLGFQEQYNELHKKFLAEQQELEKKFAGLFAPGYAKRAQIVIGEYEPTDEEVAKGSKITELEEAPQTAKGIPDFWLTALKNNDMTEELITTRDEEALKSLVDITTSPFEEPAKGFELSFHFTENAFFTNKVLTKKYFLVEDDEVLIDKAEGCEIDWKPNKNLTVVLKQKKQRHKGSKSVRTVTKAEPCDSFFNFFSPPKLPDEEDEEQEEDELDELEELVERDYEIGVVVKDKLIPRAVAWFTGEAIPPLQFRFGGDEGDEEEEDDGEGEGGAKPKVAQEAPECKQQ
eukprot:TRINITY_DN8443_c0_g1_i1.p1 TRINITY_DN8443_c0_g1~~TRINITY_DN8443_c0_g1_i1.p1  ORF type:complete len:343 (+),score=96.54 TRINITY_DN8443_c0_g1_i1:20-1048(+)